MPDLATRAEWERKLARAVGKEMQQELNKLLDLLGDPPDLNNVPSAYWDNGGKALRGVIEPILGDIALDAAEALLGEISVGVDWALVNAEAAAWARQYTYELVKGITDNSREALQKIIGNYFEQGQTMGDIVPKLESLFGPIRGEAIAVTEVTRSANQGEEIIKNELQKAGLKGTPVWNTNNDDLVCPICAPRNGKKQGDGWTDPPPGHVRCRCWQTWVWEI